VEGLEAPVEDKDTQSQKLWNEIRTLISAQDPAFFQKRGIWRVRNERTRDFSTNIEPEDWTGTRWDDCGVFAFQVPHPETRDLWIHINGRDYYNQYFNISIDLGDAELECLEVVEP